MMLPIQDSITSKKKPWVTYILIALNILIHLFAYSSRVTSERFYFGVLGMIPNQLFYSLWHGQYIYCITLLTSQFVHGSLSHLIGNMIYLAVFGDNIEEEMGHFPFLLFYLCSGIVGALAHALSDMASFVPLIGASAAVAGLLGAYLILYPGSRIRSVVPMFFFIPLNIPAWVFLVSWILLQVINVITPQLYDSISYMGHIGGFVLGVFIGLWLKRRRRNRWELIEIGDDDSSPDEIVQ